MNNIKRGKLIGLFLLVAIVLVPFGAIAKDACSYTSILRGKVVDYSQDGPNRLTITLDTHESGIITRSFWVDSGKIGQFINDLEIAKINGTWVELRYHRNWTYTPHLILDDVINISNPYE